MMLMLTHLNLLYVDCDLCLVILDFVDMLICGRYVTLAFLVFYLHLSTLHLLIEIDRPTRLTTRTKTNKIQLAGAVAIEHMGGPKILWRQGRRDAPDASACPPDGRLPAPDKGKVGATIRHIRQVFERQGFNDREIVALIGAHALGRCHPKASGYSGPWTRSPTTFSNQFFKELADNTWTLKQWDGPDQFEDPTGDLMMLPADMALLWDSEFRKYVVEFARDEDSFFRDFAMAFQKLEENGVKAFDSLGGGGQGKPWYQFW